MSESTCKHQRGTYRTRELDLVVVKGKTQPVAIYEVLDYHTEETFPNIVEVLGLFKDGLTSYRARRWDQAIKLFSQALALNPNDKPSQLYIERAEHLKANPPPDDWVGVWVMDSK